VDIEYKSATEADCEAIFNECRRLIFEYEDTESIDTSRVLSWVRRKIADSIGDYTRVCVDGRTVGYYHFFKNEDGEWELDDFYILDGFRGRGIGSEVLSKLTDEADGDIMLYVFKENTRALALYKRFGFSVAQTLRTRYIMRKKKA
jgi:ribosomal protein S18 acetylase RimI-like enzyme